jgi:hypothetical protein
VTSFINNFKKNKKMSRVKKTQSFYNQAAVRYAALESIDRELDLGNGLTLAEFNVRIKLLQDRLTVYNRTLSTLDEMLNQVYDAERSVRDLNERMLIGVAAKFGKDSNEYEKAGGTKKSERRRKSKKEAVKRKAAV